MPELSVVDIRTVEENVQTTKMSRSGAEMRASESESKAIQDRITAIEKHLGLLCDTFASYTRKTARLRDKGDLLCREIAEYAEYEKWNPSLRQGLNHYAEVLSGIQDYREAEVHRLEKKVVSQLSGYGLLCKQTKNDLKGAFTAQSREAAQKKKLEQMKMKTPQNRQQIAEAALQKASINASRSQHSLETQIESFEAKKLRDMKNVLKEFCNIELLFHAKALELYTQCFQTLEVVDPDADMEEFKKQIRPSNTSRKEIARSASQQSLNSQTSSKDNVPPAAPRPQPQPPSLRTSSAPVTNGIRRETLEDDSDDDYDDDDEDDEDDSEDYTGDSTARSNTTRSTNPKR